MVAFIDACREDFGVEPICAQLPIAPSSYYDAKSRPVSARARRHAAMTVVLVALWAANYRVYGARKLWLAARRAGHEIGRDQVAALMRAAGICGVTRRRRARTTVRDPGAQRPGDLVNRDFTARSPNRLWVTDLTVAAHPDRSRLCVFHRRRVQPAHRGLARRGSHAHRDGPRRRRDGTARPRSAHRGPHGALRRRQPGRIQPVVATPRDGGGRLWVLASVSRRFVRCGARCGRRGGPRRRGVRIGSGSGRRSLAGCRARTRPVLLGCRRRWGRGGSDRLAGCHRSVWLRCRSGICVSWSVRRSRSRMPRAQGCGRSRAELGRSPSMISRELRRNASTRSYAVPYRATTAQWHAQRRASRPKVSKLASNDTLRAYVQDRLAGQIARPDGELVAGPDVRFAGRRHGRRADRRWAKSWSPEQISHRLRVDFPDDESMRISR